jgi:putative endonuclease
MMTSAMARTKVNLGQRGENLAAEALERHGYALVERNWRCHLGEVDLVHRKGDHLYFVEVRTRRTTGYPTPEHSLTPKKAARMESVARVYIGSHTSASPLTWHVSFVAVATDSRGRPQRITFYPSLYDEPVDLL